MSASEMPWKRAEFGNVESEMQSDERGGDPEDIGFVSAIVQLKRRASAREVKSRSSNREEKM
jgi:hypothetical protein